jgi:hypothetical protein
MWQTARFGISRLLLGACVESADEMVFEIVAIDVPQFIAHQRV